MVCGDSGSPFMRGVDLTPDDGCCPRCHHRMILQRRRRRTRSGLGFLNPKQPQGTRRAVWEGGASMPRGFLSHLSRRAWRRAQKMRRAAMTPTHHCQPPGSTHRLMKNTT